VKTTYLFWGVLVSSGIFAQPDLLSPKPKIEINGQVCSILYEQYSCSTRICNGITIETGDSVTFCTVSPFIELNNPGYYVLWEFNGSNIPVAFDSFPAPTPVCHYPKWNSPGNYVVDVYYFGTLASCCCDSVPSHWQVSINVSSLNSKEEYMKSGQINIYPIPADKQLRISNSETKQVALFLRNSIGQVIYSVRFSGETEVNTSLYAAGVYYAEIRDEKSLLIDIQKVVVVH
jgi:hypothetical protein